MKKILGLTIALMLLFAAAVPALAQGDGKVTIWMGGTGSEVTDWKNNAILNAIEEAVGVEIELVWIPDGMADMLTAGAISGNLPDIIGCVDHEDRARLQLWVDGGIVAAVAGEVAQVAPNWTNLYEANEGLNELRINGEIYMVPVSWGTGCAPNMGLVHVRGDLMEKYGFETIDTYEQYVQYLRAAVADGYIGISYNGANGINKLLNVFLGGQGLPMTGWIRGEDGNFSYWMMQKGVATAVEQIRQLQNEGLLDPGIWSCDSDTARTNYVSGKAASWIGNGGGHIGRIQNDMALIDENFVEILLPALDFGGSRGYTQEDMFWGASLLGNTESCDPVLAAKIINYLLSDEGYQLTAIGIEGRDFEYDSNGDIVLLDARYQDGFPTEAGSTGAHKLASGLVSWVPQEWQDFSLLYGTDDAFQAWYYEQRTNQQMYQIPNYGRNLTSAQWNDFNAVGNELFTRFAVEALAADSGDAVLELWLRFADDWNAAGGEGATVEMNELLKSVYSD